MDKFGFFPPNGNGDEFAETVKEVATTPPEKKKAGRKTNAELDAREAELAAREAALAAREGAAQQAPMALKAEVLVQEMGEVVPFPEPIPDEQAEAMLDEYIDVLLGDQAMFEHCMDVTGSLDGHDASVRRGVEVATDTIAKSEVAKRSITTSFLKFSKTTELTNITRGKFEIPPIRYVTGTYLKPVLFKTAAVTAAFNRAVVKSGGVVKTGITVIQTDCQFHDWADAHRLIPSWKDWMRKHGQIVVVATVGVVHDPYANALAMPLPPVSAETLTFESLFRTLASTLVTSLAGGRLEELLKAELTKASKGV